MIKAVFFDFDGTMMDTRSGIENSWKYIFNKLKGVEPDEEILRLTFGEPLKTSLLKFFPEYDIDESIEIYREYIKLNPEDGMKPFPGIVNTVKALYEKGLKLAIVTSRTEESTHRELKKIGLFDCFGSIQTATNCENHKPHPEPIFNAMRDLGLEKDEVIMVGDTLFDLQASKRAGVKSVLVGWTEDVKEDEIQGEYAPDYILEKAEDIFKILEEEKDA
ncbi:MAG: HAD family hydrolase [Eubacterium sp.]|nr:HAD family hydrolase [Eubacterium sp.]